MCCRRAPEPEMHSSPLGAWPHSLSSMLASLGCTLGLFNISRFAILSIHFGGRCSVADPGTERLRECVPLLKQGVLLLLQLPSLCSSCSSQWWLGSHYSHCTPASVSALVPVSWICGTYLPSSRWVTGAELGLLHLGCWGECLDLTEMLHNLYSGDWHCAAGITSPHWYLQHCGCVLDVHLLPRLIHHKARQLPVGWALQSIPRR